MKKWKRGELGTCGYKRRYHSKTSADTVVLRLAKQGDETIQSYKCKFCGHWHVGHPREGRDRA